jgi:hypothetical protein
VRFIGAFALVEVAVYILTLGRMVSAPHFPGQPMSGNSDMATHSR